MNEPSNPEQWVSRAMTLEGGLRVAQERIAAALALAEPTSIEALIDRVTQHRFTDDDGNDVGGMRSSHAAAGITLTLDAVRRALTGDES